MNMFWRSLVGAMLALKLWKHWQVWHFLRRPRPPQQRTPQLVSILQPILSGDPTLEQGLRGNIELTSAYPLELIWLIDDNDAEAQRVCQRLQAAYPQQRVHIIESPPPPQRVNPKMFKLQAALPHASGDVICILDDDTQLPQGGLEQCLPYLDQPQAGLVFGLPYYRHFGNLWSSLVALLVNDQSLLTYVPYLRLSDPLTINGMFYALRREVLAELGDFAGLESVLADDFAVASAVRQAGYRLVQTPVRHGIRTHVSDAGHYRRLIQRWFIFPRESLLRYLDWRGQAILLGLLFAPALFPIVLTAVTAARPTRANLALASLYFGHSIACYAHFNAAYLERATPWPLVALVPLIETLFPLQLLSALLAPQRINWRGHVIQVERGGGFRFVQRRDETAQE